MREQRRRKGIAWSSLISWLIFIMIIAGQPLLGVLRNLFGASVTGLSNLFPIVIGGLVVVSIIVSAVRAIGNRPNRDTYLPSQTQLPPLGSESSGIPQDGAPFPRVDTTGSSLGPSLVVPSGSIGKTQQAPGFEPVISPAIWVIALVGAFGLLGLGLLLFMGSAP